MASRPVAKVQEIHPSATPSCSCSHAVQFYDNDSALVEALGHHIGAALTDGDTAIVVATKAHRKGLAEELRLRKVDAASAVKSGRYIELDAAGTLARFMTGGAADKQKFDDTVGALVSHAEEKTKAGKRLVVFGEMVALLWAEGKRDATVRLEELWNELAQRHTFHLLCGYPIGIFDRLEHRQLFFSICGEHTHVNPAESYPARGSETQRRKSVARLQQKTRALENEIRLSQQRLLLLQKVTRAGTWELDIANDMFSFSTAAAKVFGFQFSSRMRLSQLMDLMYYSGDREAVFTRLQEAQRHRKDFSATFRIRNGEETRIIEMRGKTFYNSGSPIMLGVVSDVTPATEPVTVADREMPRKRFARLGS